MDRLEFLTALCGTVLGIDLAKGIDHTAQVVMATAPTPEYPDRLLWMIDEVPPLHPNCRCAIDGGFLVPPEYVEGIESLIVVDSKESLLKRLRGAKWKH